MNNKIPSKKRHLDLATTMVRRECNHLRLLKLMPDWQNLAEFKTCCPLASGQQLDLTLTILERTTYTLVVQIEQQVNQNSLSISWLQNIQVRIYLDTRSAEVIACNNQSLPNWCTHAATRVEYLQAKVDCDQFLDDLLSFWMGNAMALPEAVPSFIEARQNPIKKSPQNDRMKHSYLEKI